ncbi:MAG: hypothetical protein NPIRA03_26150 [Nitrospirales bacterium]|nr:MAG: hypothetical protein NPIRA03_26150 [Nitrospirales bacterium]
MVDGRMREAVNDLEGWTIYLSKKRKQDEEEESGQSEYHKRRLAEENLRTSG